MQSYKASTMTMVGSED
jgi:hypothetical protein